jgi:hypothetical protein
MTMNDLDELGRRAATQLIDQIGSRIDVEAALREVRGTNLHEATVMPPRPASARRWLMVVATAAALVLLVAGLVWTRHRDARRVVPVDTTAAPSTTSPVPSTTAATTTTSVAAEPLQQAVVTVDDNTPMVTGEVLYSLGASAHRTEAAVTPSGRVFVAATDGTSGDVMEVVNGVANPAGFKVNGHLLSTTDERLVDDDWTANQLVVWKQDASGQWSSVVESGSIGGCGPDAESLEAPCGPAIQAVLDPVSSVDWADDMVLTETTSDDVLRWQISLDSTDVSIADCIDDQCMVAHRVGTTDIAWTPIVDTSPFDDARLVSVLHRDLPATTAWLSCGIGCRVIGSGDGVVYTVGHGPTGDDLDNYGIFIRRFSTDFASVSSDTSADAMQDWAAAPPDHPSLTDLPHLLLASPASTVTPTRTEHADDPVTLHSYEQYWFSFTRDAALWITTWPGQAAPEGEQEAVTVAPWDAAAFRPSGGGYLTIELTDPSGSVSISAFNLSRSEMLAIARSLQRDDSGGWHPVYVPADFLLVHYEWTQGAAMRTLQWVDGGAIVEELTVAHGVPSLFQAAVSGTTIRAGWVNGAIAATAQQGDRSVVIWSVAPGVVVRLGFSGPLDKALASASSITNVDPETWLATSVPDTSTDDGCSSMFC